MKHGLLRHEGWLRRAGRVAGTNRLHRGLVLVVAGLALGSAVTASAALAAPRASFAVAAEPGDWSNDLWLAAKSGDIQTFDRLMGHVPDSEPSDVAGAISHYQGHLAARDAERQTQIATARKEMDDILAGADPKDADLSKALVSAVSLHESTAQRDRAALMAEPGIQLLTSVAERRARDAEGRGDWLMANELFYRLHLLYEESGRFKKDADRLNQRLALIQLYAPARLWQMRNDRRVADGESALPPYNAAADDYHTKIAGSSKQIIRQALSQAEAQHVESVPLRDMILAGLDAVEVLATTHDLDGAFPEMSSPAHVEAFLHALATERERVQTLKSPATVADALRALLTLEQTSDASVRIPSEVLIHEFGNGAVNALDEFSQIIWPDDVRQFERLTQGNFTGVGIHIQMDAERNIEVVTPLEGTPAHRAGIRPRDRIRAVNGVPTLGMGINQAVDLITGPAGTEVVLGLDRPDTEADDTTYSPVDVTLKRSQIRVRTVKGWERTGEGEGDWNWFIDSERGIGYVRLIQFTETTTSELRSAVSQMRDAGLKGLILDLRFNPGGLLNEAVSVSDLFIREGPIVSTQDRFGNVGGIRRAAQGAPLGDIPVVVLINEGSASASEIVSGAIQDVARRGELDAVVLGHRSFGKGSVQRVWPIPGDISAMKLTTEYYLLPSGRKIHRRPGDTMWGVQPDFDVEMLPSQITRALEIRQQADVIPLAGDAPQNRPDPRQLVDGGIDLQLESALLLLQARTEPPALVQGSKPNP